MVLSVDVLDPQAKTPRDLPGSSDASFSARAVRSDPAGISDDHRCCRSSFVAFQVFEPVGFRAFHEAHFASLALRPEHRSVYA